MTATLDTRILTIIGEDMPEGEIWQPDYEGIGRRIAGNKVRFNYRRDGLAVVEAQVHPDQRKKGVLGEFLAQKAKAYDEHRRTKGLTSEEAGAVQDSAGRYYRVVKEGNILYLKPFAPAEREVNLLIAIGSDILDIGNRLNTPQTRRAVTAASLVGLSFVVTGCPGGGGGGGG